MLAPRAICRALIRPGHIRQREAVPYGIDSPASFVHSLHQTHQRLQTQLVLEQELVTFMSLQSNLRLTRGPVF